MKVQSLNDVNLLDFGTEVAAWGVVFQGKGKMYVIPFPDSPDRDVDESDLTLLHLRPDDFALFLGQLDMVNVQMSDKTMVRKSQRRIDSAITWSAYARDGYRCRYCYVRGPLTVDHVDLWEDGGAPVLMNLISACGKCNRTRGRMKYEDWIESPEYEKRSVNLPDEIRYRNRQVVDLLPELRKLRGTVRSR